MVFAAVEQLASAGTTYVMAQTKAVAHLDVEKHPTLAPRAIRSPTQNSPESNTVNTSTPSINVAADIYARPFYCGVNARAVALTGGACFVVSFVAENIINKYI